MSLEIGLVGVGPWGANILRDLRALGAVVHAAARRDGSRERAEAGGAASVVDSPENLPRSCAGFVVANRTISHLDAVEALLPRGRPIFVEKPLSNDVVRAKRLPAAADGLVFVMHKWRYHPAIVELARIAREQRYGPVEGLRTYRLGWGNPHADVSSLWVLAPHDLSIALSIFGETPRLVSAQCDALSGGDAATAHLRTRAGQRVTLEVSSAHPVNLRRIIMRCRDAVCLVDGADYGAIQVRRFLSGEPAVLRVSDEMPLLAELRAFLTHLQGGPAPLTALREEIEIIETIAAIETAAAA